MKLNVTKQKLILDKETIAEGAVNYATFQLNCDKSWKGLTKTVRFTADDGISVYDVPEVEENKIYYIPNEVLVKGKITVGVIGVSDKMTVTTATAFFTVEESIDRGRMPSVTHDAYAKYVHDASAHRKAAEEAEATSLACLEKCQRLKSQADSLVASALESERNSRKILEEVSCMLNAVGVAFRDIMNTGERLLSLDSNLYFSESKREKGEKARVFSESRRAEAEAERRAGETRREAAEARRMTAENVRALSEAERTKRFADIETRLSGLEEIERVDFACVFVAAEGEGELDVIDSCALFDSITLYGNTELVDGELCGVGEEGFVTFTVGDAEISIPVSRPLYSAGNIRDELTVSADGSVTVLRRISQVTLDGTVSAIRDDSVSERVMYVTPLLSDLPKYNSTEGISSSFSYGANNLADSVWISGDYVFLDLDSNEYPDVTALAQKLSEKSLVIVYPKQIPTQEAEGSIAPMMLAFPNVIKYDGNMKLNYKKNIFNALETLTERLNKIEKEKDNDNNIEEIHIA